MARLPRITPVGVPVHVIQRGNNRQVCFVSIEDHVVYAGWLKEYSEKYGVDIHAWVMLTNHVHLLCTPQREGGLSCLIRHWDETVRAIFNFTYRRSGALWEGRYKSCLVQAEQYLLELDRYIELNPVRADMVTDPGEYRWSSYQINALGKVSDLCTPHPEYLVLGAESEERLINYRALFTHHVDGKLMDEIRANSNKCMAVGNDQYKEEMESLAGRRLRAKKRGRPLGWRKLKT